LALLHFRKREAKFLKHIRKPVCQNSSTFAKIFII